MGGAAAGQQRANHIQHQRQTGTLPVADGQRASGNFDGRSISRELSRSVAVLNVEGFPLQLDQSLVWRTGDLSPAATTFRDYLLGYGQRAVAHLSEPNGIGEASLESEPALDPA